MNDRFVEIDLDKHIAAIWYRLDLIDRAVLEQLEKIKNLQEVVMSDVSNEQQLETDLSALSGVVDEVVTEVSNLQQTAAQGGQVTAADLSKLTDLTSKLQATVPAAPAAPAPADNTGTTGGDVTSTPDAATNTPAGQ